MKAFRIHLIRFGDVQLYDRSEQEFIYDGKFTLDARGRICGVLEQKWSETSIEKSFIYGIYDEETHQLLFIQFHNERNLWHYPNIYKFSASESIGVWEAYNYPKKGFWFYEKYTGSWAKAELQEILNYEMKMEEKEEFERVKARYSFLEEYLDFDFVHKPEE